MQLLTDTIERLQERLDEALDDWDTRRVLADAYEESGEMVLAAGQRWQAEHHKFPYAVDGTLSTYWHWWADAKPYPESSLGRRLTMSGPMVRYDNGNPAHQRYPTRQEAERALAKALSWVNP